MAADERLPATYNVLPTAPRDMEANFELGKKLGKGSFGVVHECTSRVTNFSYACKMIEKRQLRDELDAEDVRREVRLLMRLAGHPNIVELHDVYEDDERVYLVMELCKGGDLFDEIKKNGPFSERDACSVFRQLASCVAFCHANGIMHRDLKPENVLLLAPSPPPSSKASSLSAESMASASSRLNVGGTTSSSSSSDDGSSSDGEGSSDVREPSAVALRGGIVKLADFGLATELAPGESTSGLTGSRYYTAPEMVRGRRYGKRADVWSLGVVLCTLLTGRLPFAGKTHADEEGLKRSILRGSINFEAPVWKEVSTLAKDLVRSMLQVDPRLRLKARAVVEHPWLLSAAPAPWGAAPPSLLPAGKGLIGKEASSGIDWQVFVAGEDWDPCTVHAGRTNGVMMSGGAKEKEREGGEELKTKASVGPIAAPPSTSATAAVAAAGATAGAGEEAVSLRSAIGNMTAAAVAALQRRLAAVTGGTAGDIVPGSGATAGGAGGNTGSNSSNNNNNNNSHHANQHRGNSAAVSHASRAAVAAMMGVVSESEDEEGGARSRQQPHPHSHTHARVQAQLQPGMSGSRGSSSMLPLSLSPAAAAMVGLRCGMVGTASPAGDPLSFPSRGSQSPLRGRGETVTGVGGAQGSGGISTIQGGVGVASGRRPRGSPALRSLLATVDVTAAHMQLQGQPVSLTQQQAHQTHQNKQQSGSAAAWGAGHTAAGGAYTGAGGATRAAASPRSPGSRHKLGSVTSSPRGSPNTPKDHGSMSGRGSTRGTHSGSGMMQGRSGNRLGAVMQPPLLSLPASVATGAGRNMRDTSSPRCVLVGTPSVPQAQSSKSAAAGGSNGHGGSPAYTAASGAPPAMAVGNSSSSNNRSLRTDRRKVVPVLTVAPATGAATEGHEGMSHTGGQSSTVALKLQQQGQGQLGQRVSHNTRSGPLMLQPVIEAAGVVSGVNGGGGAGMMVKSTSRLSMKQRSGRGVALESGSQQQQQEEAGEAAEVKRVGVRGVVAAFEERMARLEACRSLLLASAGRAGIIQQQQQQVTNTDGNAWKSLIAGQKEQLG